MTSSEEHSLFFACWVEAEHVADARGTRCRIRIRGRADIDEIAAVTGRHAGRGPFDEHDDRMKLSDI